MGIPAIDSEIYLFAEVLNEENVLVYFHGLFLFPVPLHRSGFMTVMQQLRRCFSSSTVAIREEKCSLTSENFITSSW